MCGIATGEARRVIAVVWTGALCGTVPEERENTSVHGVGAGFARAGVGGRRVAAGDSEGGCWCWGYSNDQYFIHLL